MGITFVVVGGLVVLLLIIALDPLAIVEPDPGGGDDPPPPPPPGPPPVPPPATPVPNSITPNPDTDGSVLFKWAAVSTATGYEVHMNKNGGSWQLISTTTAIAIVKGGLTNGVYSFKVRSYNSIGYSPFSISKSVTVSIYIPPPPPPVPDPPTTPTISKIYPDPDPDGSITVSWSKPVDAMGFKLYRSKNGEAYILISQSLFTQYIDKNLDNGVYYYKVQAYNDAGMSEYSNVVFVAVDIPTLPDVPILNNIPIPNTDGFITLKWSDSGDVNGFEIFRSVNGGSFMFFEDLTSTTHQFSESNGDYSYKVRAYNDLGFSEYSNIVSVTVTISEIPPPVPIEPTEPEPTFNIVNLLTLILVSATVLVSAFLLSKFLKKQVKQLKSIQK